MSVRALLRIATLEITRRYETRTAVAPVSGLTAYTPNRACRKHERREHQRRGREWHNNGRWGD